MAEQYVPAATLDELFESDSNELIVIKADLEGSECNALLGAQRLLEGATVLGLLLEINTDDPDSGLNGECWQKLLSAGSSESGPGAGNPTSSSDSDSENSSNVTMSA